MFHASRRVGEIPLEDLGVLVVDEQRNADTIGAAGGLVLLARCRKRQSP